MGYTWNNVIKPLNKPMSFSPMEQDKAAITIIKEQEKYNPSKQGLFQMINNGDFNTAMKLLNTTWTSFPGSTKNPLITNEEATKIYNNAIKNELNGNSIIATPQGQLEIN
jgi:muramidase (phage lysozyme)